MKRNVWLHLELASSAFTMSDSHARSDFTEALARTPDVLGVTEVGDRWPLFRDTAELHGYIPVPSGTDVAIAVRAVHSVRRVGVVPSVPGEKGPAAQGGHGPRPVLSVSLVPFGTDERVTVCLAHWVTHAADNGRQQVALTDDLATTVAVQARGTRLGFWMGDTNSPDTPHDRNPVDKALRRGDLTSCWDELGKYPATHGRDTIDVIGSYDPDLRVVCKAVRRWPAGNSDHRPVSAWYAISPTRKPSPTG